MKDNEMTVEGEARSISDRIREIQDYTTYLESEWNDIKEGTHSIESMMYVASYIQKLEDLIEGVYVDDALHIHIKNFLKLQKKQNEERVKK